MFFRSAYILGFKRAAQLCLQSFGDTIVDIGKYYKKGYAAALRAATVLHDTKKLIRFLGLIEVLLLHILIYQWILIHYNLHMDYIMILVCLVPG